MILILSEQVEPSTAKVMDWLDYFGQKFHRLNAEDYLFNKIDLEFGLSSEELTFQFTSSDLEPIIISGVDAIWYRRISFSYFPETGLPFSPNELFKNEILRNLHREYLSGKDGIFACIEDGKKILGNFRNSTVNKIEILALVKKHGLDIPASLLTNTKAKLTEFKYKHGSIITKAAGEILTFKKVENSKTSSYITYTEEITAEVLEQIPEHFYYSLFQEKLDKELEIRTFFLNDKCYSTAIFSQLNMQPQVDSRKNTNDRKVPFKLPDSIENAIREIMAELELNTGSVDIVKTKGGRFVFLEVNPVGQYDMTSYSCNYHLDMEIAEYLSLNRKNEKYN